MIFMISSAKARKQRKFRFTAPMHVRQNFANAHISKDLASKLGIKRRAIEVRKGDTVKVMSGDNKGKTGKVASVDLKRVSITVEGVTRKNSKNKELLLAISPSSVYLIDLDLTDKYRKAEIDGLKSKK